MSTRPRGRCSSMPSMARCRWVASHHLAPLSAPCPVPTHLPTTTPATSPAVSPPPPPDIMPISPRPLTSSPAHSRSPPSGRLPRGARHRAHVVLHAPRPRRAPGAHVHFHREGRALAPLHRELVSLRVALRAGATARVVVGRVVDLGGACLPLRPGRRHRLTRPRLGAALGHHPRPRHPPLLQARDGARAAHEG